MPIWRTSVRVTHSSMPGPGFNTWHARTDGSVSEGPAAGDLAGLQVMISDFYAILRGIYPGGTAIQCSGEWRRVDGDGEEVVSIPGFTLSETGTAPPLPPANVLCVTWRTPSATRSGRGRSFLGPMKTSSLQSNGSPTEQLRTDVDGACKSLIAASSGFANGAIVVWSPTKGIARDIVRASVPNEFAVLRSRRD